MSYHKYSTSPNERISTVVDLLRWRAEIQPEFVSYTFLGDTNNEQERLTYGELDQLAKSLGAWLQSQGAANERVLLLYPPGLAYVVAFFGCLYAGAIAVPAYPPRANRSLERLQIIAADAGARFALTTGPILSKIEKVFGSVPRSAGIRWLNTDQLVTEKTRNASWREPAVSRETIAFLQYTSGSTASPKGVMVTHGNLLHNERMIQVACDHNEESTFAGWLPLYHDMGLIGNLLQPLFIGARCILMSPVSFLQKPLRWLQAISDYRVATSGGPNFAYDLCVRKISAEERSTLDLSSWTTAFNGAEPVRYETMKRFAETFAPCGFRSEAFYPCYGLAEATLMVTGGYKLAPPVTCDVERQAFAQDRVVEATAATAATRTLVGSGHALLDEVILVANPDTLTKCQPGEIGEIWVSGGNVAAGYWNCPDQTEQTFHAFLRDSGEGPFLRTGDLGFLREGELFVTGRLKDLIIIRGQNHYPQDIELTTETSHAALRPGCSAAFSVEVDGEERLVVVQELDMRQAADQDEVFTKIREAIAGEHELEPFALVLVKQGSILKTSSGKIQRQACRSAFLEGKLEAVAEWRSALTLEPELPALISTTQRSTEEIEAWLATELATKLRVNSRQVDLSRPLAQFGLDSLMAAEVTQRIEEVFGVTLPLTSFLQDQTISQLVSRIVDEIAGKVSETRTLSLTSSASPNGFPSEHPLSSNQQALWYLYRLAPESAAYSIVRAARIRSRLDVPALRRAFQSLVNRHPSLRSTFHWSDRGPLQRIEPHVEVSFEQVSASGFSETELQQQLVKEAHLPFDLEHGPIVRIKLWKRFDREYILLLAFHHIVTDLWSMAVLMDELGALYDSEVAGKDAHLPALSSTFSEYVTWQSEMLAGAQGEKLARYWEAQLAGAAPKLELPIDHPRPPVQTYEGSSYSFSLGPGLTDQIKDLARKQDATLYTTLLATFETLLFRYTGQEDFLIGSPSTGRSKAQSGSVVGYFVNPLVLRANCAGGPTFREFLARVRQTVLGALEHQDYSFPVLVERLQPERDVSRSPLFQTMFVFHRAHLPGREALSRFAIGDEGARVRLGSLELESIKLEHGIAQFDLTLAMTETAGELHASFEYNTDLFDESTIHRFAQHFTHLLESIVANSTQRLSVYSFLPRSEQQLLAEWNQTRRNYERPSCLHRLFEQQVERTPENVALIFEDEVLTYRELNERANQLAHELAQLGVGPEDLVGVLLERSIEMVVSLLGILKAGGAYVPLDPSYPAERIAFMLEDAGVSVLLTQAHLRDRLPQILEHVVLVDDEEQFFHESSEPPEVEVSPENLAYVIYTSGSTGRPKGVLVQHANVLRLLHATQAWFSFDEHDVWTLFHSAAFDFSVWEIWGALCYGGRLVVVPYLVSRSPDAFYQLLTRERVTVLNQTPSAFRQLMQAEEALAAQAGDEVTQQLALRLVIFGGEALVAEQLQPWFDRHDDECPQLVNMYGITETTVHVTYYPMRRIDAEKRGLGSVIGRPIPDLSVYLLDKHGRPVPIGVPGELHVGGAGVARGYLRRPELTAERFVPDPFSGTPGARLYRSGDLARYLPDGNLEYLGRTDHQVKVRGHRIELGEIEAALRQHENVREGVVVTREDAPGDKRLVAYVVAEGETPSVGGLRAHLNRFVPDYMTPAHFVVLDELPLTTNGKVDRKALPAPVRDRSELDASHVLPSNEVERTVAGIWQEVLGLKNVGVNDKFFDLGGHSLLMAQVHGKLRQKFDIELPMIELLKYPTISSLSRRLRRRLDKADTSDDAASLEKLTAGENRMRRLRQGQLRAG